MDLACDSWPINSSLTDHFPSTTNNFCLIAESPGISPIRDIVIAPPSTTTGEKYSRWMTIYLPCLFLVTVVLAIHYAQRPRYTNHLWKLPLELFLIVNTFQDHASALCLWICRYEMVNRNEWEMAAPDVQDEVLDRLRNDIFPKLCEREKIMKVFTMDEQSKLVCSGCRVLHHRSLFSTGQLRAKPERRLCLGTEGAIRVCEHNAYKREQLRQRMHLSTAPVELCDSPDHDPKYVARAAPLLHHKCHNTGDLARCSICVIETTTVLFEGSGNKVFMIPELVKTFKHHNYRLCPHLLISDDAAIKMLFPFEHTSFGMWEGYDRARAFCSKPHCGTTFSISVERTRRIAPVEHTARRGFSSNLHNRESVFAVILHVRKTFGNLEDATDPDWVSQLQETQWIRFGKSSDCLVCKHETWPYPASAIAINSCTTDRGDENLVGGEERRDAMATNHFAKCKPLVAMAEKYVRTKKEAVPVVRPRGMPPARVKASVTALRPISSPVSSWIG
ncbi:hypothetical protein IWX50DRAFT_618021 [Phyllosticta citricarpa]